MRHNSSKHNNANLHHHMTRHVGPGTGIYHLTYRLSPRQGPHIPCYLGLCFTHIKNTDTGLSWLNTWVQLMMPQNWAFKEYDCNFGILSHLYTFKLILNFCSLSNRENWILFWSLAGKGWCILKQEILETFCDLHKN
jgi:hypothetical protein